MCSYHVTFGVDKRVLQVASKERNEILSAVAKVFNLKSPSKALIQQWDVDFDDLVTVVATEDLPDKCKLGEGGATRTPGYDASLTKLFTSSSLVEMMLKIEC